MLASPLTEGIIADLANKGIFISLYRWDYTDIQKQESHFPNKTTQQEREGCWNRAQRVYTICMKAFDKSLSKREKADLITSYCV